MERGGALGVRIQYLQKLAGADGISTMAPPAGQKKVMSRKGALLEALGYIGRQQPRPGARQAKPRPCLTLRDWARIWALELPPLPAPLPFPELPQPTVSPLRLATSRALGSPVGLGHGAKVIPNLSLKTPPCANPHPSSPLHLPTQYLPTLTLALALSPSRPQTAYSLQLSGCQRPRLPSSPHAYAALMSMRIHPSTPDYELLPRASSDADDLDLDLGLHPRPVVQRHVPQPSWLALLGSKMSGVDKLVDPVVCAHYVTPRRRKRSVLRLIYWSIFSVPYICLFLVLSAVVLFPSYTHRPAHYNELRNRAIATNALGRANVRNEKVFIAAAIYEDRGALTSGPWGKAVLDLVDLLGPQNVHLSIFENDPDVETRQSLLDFEKKAPCNTHPLAYYHDFVLTIAQAIPPSPSRTWI